jgi:hypothetical protein
MPNGGHPGYMVLRPRRDTGHVVECRFATLHVVPEVAATAPPGPVRPVLELDADEVAVLVDFLGFWLHEHGHRPQAPVNARYDY